MARPVFRNDQLYGFLPSDIKGIDVLAELALDLRWSWNHAADELWQTLDAELWDATRNPWVVLQTVSHEHLQHCLASDTFRQIMDDLLKQKIQSAASLGWFQQRYPSSALTHVAYFSMEFMLSEALPIYVGGLGNVAGDQLKAASDLGVPVIGIGLLYQQGYFRQDIDEQGWQQAYFPYNDPGQLPVMPLRLPGGEWLRLKIFIAGYPVWLRTWQVQVGRTRLLLLDTNDPANLPVHRNLTNELYGGGSLNRIQQEMVLAIGGWQMLQALNISPQVCHLNEGHAAFLVLERARSLMKETGMAFKKALTITRAGNIFTTHTAVAAGFDVFDAALMYKFLGAYAEEELGISFGELMALGRARPDDMAEGFNMAFLAIRGCGAVNGVSKLHGEVSRQILSDLFPRWPLLEVPVGTVTNGVHMPSWDSEFADAVWTAACGKNRWRGNLENVSEDIAAIPDEVLWDMRNHSRRQMVQYIHKRFEKQVSAWNQTIARAAQAGMLLNPNVLTLGFARRFVAYKRTNLMLHNEKRLLKLLHNTSEPLQIVIAGKAPPFDDGGKQLIRQWVQFIERNHLHHRVVFLSDYDMLLTENLVQGVDVWLNTPRRPWEACGTSGMKVLVNGGLNLSELDGWWAEAYTPDVGWALGGHEFYGNDTEEDAAEANALYNLLEQEIIPAFYNRNEMGLPVQWLQRVRNSMASLSPSYSANRTVREYVEQYYLPAAGNYLQRLANDGAEGLMITRIQQEISKGWQGIKFGSLQVETQNDGYIFAINVFLNGINPTTVQVSMYADEADGYAPENWPMAADDTLVNMPCYSVKIVSQRAVSNYTARIVPCYNKVAIPLEDNHILWSG